MDLTREGLKRVFPEEGLLQSFGLLHKQKPFLFWK